MATYAANQVAARVRWPAVSAEVPILASKITAPGVLDWTVPRPRITKLIAQGARWCPLTVVTGPAGAGKTMALALWAAAEPGPVAWACLDGYDNRPGVFWSYVVAALRRSGVAVPGALPAARRPDAGHVFLLPLAGRGGPPSPPARADLMACRSRRVHTFGSHGTSAMMLSSRRLACTATACGFRQHKANRDGRLVLARVALKRTVVM